MMSFLEVTTRATLQAVVSPGGTLRFDGKETPGGGGTRRKIG